MTKAQNKRTAELEATLRGLCLAVRRELPDIALSHSAKMHLADAVEEAEKVLP